MRIYLVRHGESQGNADKNVHRQIADHAIPLSEKGMEQAWNAGKFLAQHMIAHEARLKFEAIETMPDGKLGSKFAAHRHMVTGKLGFRLWTSPYRRTRETSQAVLKAIHTVTGAEPEHGVREHIMLAEQQFGLFDGLTDDELMQRYPDEHAHYKKCEDMEGRFWARMPLGESRFDVAVRVHQAFGTFHRDAERHNVRNLVVVCHGATIRAFVMQWLNLPFEWFEKEPNPKNCSVRLIENGEDRGYVYEGG